jgi:uncharacterized RDD family membrane protein YckC
MNEKIAEPTSGKRVLAHFIDLVLSLLSGLLLFFFVTSTFFLKSVGGYDDFSSACAYLDETGLFSISYSGTQAVSYTLKLYANASDSSQSGDGYDLNLGAVYGFYTDFLPQNGDAVDGVKADEHFTPAYFYETVMGLPDPSGVDPSSESSRAGSNKYFSYAIVDGGAAPALDLLALPVLQEKYAAIVGDRESGELSDTLAELNAYFYDSSSSGGLSVDAARIAVGESSVVDALSSYQLKRGAGFALALGPSFLVFVFLIPLCRKNDETIGKTICHLGVTDKNGFHLKGFRKAAHPLLMLVECLFACVYPLLIGLLAFAVLSLVDYLSLMVSKTRRSFHERIAGTMVVDMKKSIVFADEKEKDDYILAHKPKIAPLSEETKR